MSKIEIKEFVGHKAKSTKEQSEKQTVKNTKKQLNQKNQSSSGKK